VTRTNGHAPIHSAAQRTFSLIRVDSVTIVSPRARGAKQFRENVRSIADNGLYKPILVNALDHKATGRYQLICGEGRLRAHIDLKREMIKAEIVTVDLATAHIMSLGENMTKSPPRVIEYARSLYDMHERGTSVADLERITGQSGGYIRSYITLIRQGEERLIRGVEAGVIPLDFAMRVAESPDSVVQHLLVDALDKKLVSVKHVDAVRKIIADRLRHGKELREKAGRGSDPETYNVDDLKRDIQRISREKEKYSAAVQAKETRLFCLMEAIRTVRADEAVMKLLRQHKVDAMPILSGRHAG
jgi:ParB family chromosome partitioning protein